MIALVAAGSIATSRQPLSKLLATRHSVPDSMTLRATIDWSYNLLSKQDRAWLADVLERSNDLGATDLRGRAMQADGWLAVFMGDHQTARTRLEESVSILRGTGNTRELAGALVFLAYEILASDHARAHALVEEGVDLLRQSSDKFALAMSLNNSGTVAFVGKDYAAAHVRYAEAVELGRELGDNLALGASLRGLGIVASRQRKAAFNIAWTEGRVLLLHEAIEYALNGIPSPS